MLVSCRDFSFGSFVNDLTIFVLLQKLMRLLRRRSKMVLVVGVRMGPFLVLWLKSTRRTRW